MARAQFEYSYGDMIHHGYDGMLLLLLPIGEERKSIFCTCSRPGGPVKKKKLYVT